MKRTFLRLVVAVSLCTFLCSCGGGGGGGTPETPPDTEAPTITESPVGGSTISSLTTVTVTFSESVAGADVPGNYSLSGAGIGTLALGSVVDQGSNVYELTFSGLVNNGNITVTLSNISDTAGNPLAGNTISYTGTTSEPTQSATPASGGILNSLATIDITYSKQVSGADVPANYSISGTGAGSLGISSSVLLAGTTYRLTLSGTPSDGAVTITINNVEDLVGNPLVGAAIQYTIDMTAPTIASSSPANGTSVNALPYVQIDFSEAVQGASDAANYSLSGAGVGTLQLSPSIGNSGNSRSLFFSGLPVDGPIVITLSNIMDNASNPLSGTAISFQIDKTRPTQTASPASYAWIDASVPYIDVTYSEAVTGADVAGNYSLSGTGVGTLALAGVASQGGNTYRLSFSGSPQGTNTQVNIDIANVLDLVGNALIGTRITYQVDTTAPTITAVTPGAGMARGYLDSMDMTFSENLAGAGQSSSYSVSGPGAGTLSVAASQNITGYQYRLTFSGTPGIGDLTITANLADQAGNALSTNTVSYTMVAPITFTARNSGVTSALNRVAWNGSRLVVVGGNVYTAVENILQSTDGATWSAATGCAGGMKGLIWDSVNSRFISAGGFYDVAGGANTARVCVSTDGLSWTPYDLTGVSGMLLDVAYNGTNYAAISNPNTYDDCNLHLASNPTLTWTTSSCYNTIGPRPSDITAIGTTYFAVAYLQPGMAKSADNGANWSTVLQAGGNNSIMYGGGQYVVGGTLGMIRTSPDAATWTVQDTPSYDNINEIGWNGSTYLAVGDNGQIWSSTDGVTWAVQDSGTSNHLYSVVWDGGQWVIAGGGGTILTGN